MEILTVDEMQEVDRATIGSRIPGPELMEQAGTAVFRWIEREYAPGPETRVHVLCGRGNNGGDGFVIARRLAETGARVTIHLYCEAGEVGGDARVALERLEGAEIVRGEAEGASGLDARLETGDWVVDAVLGTGLRSEVREPYGSVFEVVNSARRTRDLLVISVDIPSGIDGNSGAVLGRAIRAEATVTIGRPKLGTLFHPGRSHAGRLVVAPITFPEELVRGIAGSREILTPEELARLLPEKPPTLHKYRSGALAVLSGSRRFGGAPLLVTRGAFRAGCGMVYWAGPACLEARLGGLAAETIFRGFPETAEGTLAGGSLEEILAWTSRVDALAVGPGLDRSAETLGLVGEILAAADRPAVLDADALALLEPGAPPLPGDPSRLVVTPHAGEMSRMTGERAPEDPEERIGWTQGWAESWGLTVLLKGAPTLVAGPDGPVHVCGAGTNALATAGTGDVLTGIVGSLLAQGLPPRDAARLGAYLHGRAGELAAAQGSARSVMAGDLPDRTGDVYEELEGGRYPIDPPPWITTYP